MVGIAGVQVWMTDGAIVYDRLRDLFIGTIWGDPDDVALITSS